MSLEREVFPAWLGRGLYGFRSEGLCRYWHTGSLHRGAIVFRHRSAEMNRRPCVALDGNGRRDSVFKPDSAVKPKNAGSEVQSWSSEGVRL